MFHRLFQLLLVMMNLYFTASNSESVYWHFSFQRRLTWIFIILQLLTPVCMFLSRMMCCSSVAFVTNEKQKILENWKPHL